jgi:hypothetical protein
VKSVALVVIGLLVWSVIQIAILTAQGSLTAYLGITSSVLSHHAQEVSHFKALDLLHTIWIYADIWIVLAIAGIVCAVITRKWAIFSALRLPFLFLLTGLFVVALQNKGWGYQYVIIIPGLVGMVALALSAFPVRLNLRDPKLFSIIVYLAIGILASAIGKSLKREAQNIWHGYISVTNHDTYLSSLGAEHTLYYPPQTESLAGYIRSHTKPSDRIFILGDEPGAYWRANRIPATKFTYDLLFNSGVISNRDIAGMNDSLISTTPALIAVERFDTTTFRMKAETSESMLAMDPRFAAIRNMLSDRYSASDTVCENFIIYRLK